MLLQQQSATTISTIYIKVRACGYGEDVNSVILFVSQLLFWINLKQINQTVMKCLVLKLLKCLSSTKDKTARIIQKYWNWKWQNNYNYKRWCLQRTVHIHSTFYIISITVYVLLSKLGRKYFLYLILVSCSVQFREQRASIQVWHFCTIFWFGDLWGCSLDANIYHSIEKCYFSLYLKQMSCKMSNLW